MDYKNIFEHITQEFGSLTLRERSVIARLYESEIDELEEYRKVLQEYRKGSLKYNTRIIKGSKDNNYIVEYYDDKKYFCSCPQFQFRLNKSGGKEYCKHIKEFLLKKN